MYKQTVRLFGQKCKKCRGAQYGGRYCYPLAFKYLSDKKYAGWRDICKEAIDKAERRRYMTDDIVDENLDDGVFSSMTERNSNTFLIQLFSKSHIRQLFANVVKNVTVLVGFHTNQKIAHDAKKIVEGCVTFRNIFNNSYCFITTDIYIRILYLS